MQKPTTGDKTIGEIVTADFRTATVFERHGIDFCCGGQPPARRKQSILPW